MDKVILHTQQLETLQAQMESQYSTVLQTVKFSMGLPLETELDIPLIIQSLEALDWEERTNLDFQKQESRYKLIQKELKIINFGKWEWR